MLGAKREREREGEFEGPSPRRDSLSDTPPSQTANVRPVRGVCKQDIVLFLVFAQLPRGMHPIGYLHRGVLGRRCNDGDDRESSALLAVTKSDSGGSPVLKLR